MTVQEYLDYFLNMPAGELLTKAMLIMAFAIMIDILVYSAFYLWLKK